MAPATAVARGNPAVGHIVNFEGTIEVSETNLILDPDITYERYEGLCSFVGRLSRASAWWIGALINQGEALFGEKYAQAAELTGLSYDRLSTYAWVERHVHPSNRNPALSFSHHEAVAKMVPQEQSEWLDKAVEEDLSRRQLREEIRGDVEPRERPPLLDAAKAVTGQATKRGNHYSVPLEPMARLRAALGEE